MSTNHFQTMGTSDSESITLRGFDLCDELLGEITFTQGIFLAVEGRLPTSEEIKLLDAVLVTLMDHGLTANSIATRLTYHASPDAVQGAMAAGLLGAGSKLLGALEGTARLIQETTDKDPAVTEQKLRAYIELLRRKGERIPGMGHFQHSEVDPRTVKLKELTLECGYAGSSWETLELAANVSSEMLGRDFVINADGAIGAVLSEMGIDWRISRGFAVIARSAGLLGHIKDEVENPVSWKIWSAAEEAVPYKNVREDDQ